MRTIERSTAFRRDYKRELSGRHGKRLAVLLGHVLKQLVADTPVPAANSDHPLGGDWAGFRDCHLRPDLVLIYRKTGEVLELARLGSHSELFG